MKIKVVDFTTETKDFIRSLNYEWLEKYFRVEPIDELQLANPEEEIIKKGGHIYYAASEDQIVGTATLLLKDPDVFELGKMAVTASFQGKGISNVLMDHCINEARRFGAKKLILYTNSRLVAAISLYKKYGFKEVYLQNSSYARSDMKMELHL